MSDIDVEDAPVPEQAIDETYDETAHQACYIFRPGGLHNEIDDRPEKRRKTSKSVELDETATPPLLLNGNETAFWANSRIGTFNEIWEHQQTKIDEIVDRVDEQGLRDIVRFVKDTTPGEDGKVPTGLVVAGADGSVQSRMLSKWREAQTETSTEQVVQLEASQAPNLQTALKNVIRTTITQLEGVDGCQDFLAQHKRLIPMNYDLELLQIFAEEHNVQKLVISILDVETFDMGVLCELVSILSSWSDQLQFVLLLGLATTIELFEARLSKSTIRLIDATVFDLSTHRDMNHEIYRATQQDLSNKLFLGHAAVSILVDMTTDQGTTPASFGRAIKYACMSHFFANALSALLVDEFSDEDTLLLCESIRNTDSFQTHAEELLNTGKQGAKEVQKLLQDSAHLLATARSAVQAGQRKLLTTYAAIDAFKDLPTLLRLAPPANASAFDIDMEALSGKDFVISDPYTSVMSMLERVRSDQLLGILRSYSLASDTNYGKSQQPLRNILTRLHAFQTLNNSTSTRSAYDPSHITTATTVSKSNTISLTKTAVALTEAEEQYTSIMDDLLAALEAYFDSHITKAHYKKQFMYEAFVFDLKVPLNSAFTPQPRFAIERALSRPGDYLGCDCCTVVDKESSHNQMPPSSILWNLWCEAGQIVNVRDLWEAFRGVLIGDNAEDNIDQEAEDGDAEDREEDREANGKVSERTALALFYRSLAELRMLGFIKTTKKRPAPGADCVAKSGWRGL